MVLAGIVGFVLAWLGTMPMSGPAGALFLARALEGKRLPALLIAAGSGFVEALYAFGVALFLPRVLGRTREVVLGSLALGALVVFALGMVLLLRPRLLERSTRANKGGFVQGAVSTLFNPTPIATWTLAVGALYADGILEDTTTFALVFAAGVATGSLAWFSFLLFFAKLFHIHPTRELRRKTLRVAGAVMLAAGVFLGYRFVSTLRSPGEPPTPEVLPEIIERHTTGS